jgi:CDP-glycerol glycerophosphotransferase (TagB/SpsB family)
MRIGFLVWNQFQVAHSVEIARHFDEPDFIFMDRSPEALAGFDPAWLVPYGAYCRFVSETDLQSLDGQYDAIVAQFRPPLQRPWTRTKLIMQQYSLAKPKTAYNGRWFTADRGLVYGKFSASIIAQMCQVSQAGNPRFDPHFERRLNPDLVRMVKGRLDPARKTLVYLPTWGDLGTSDAFVEALGSFSDRFNIIVRPHHLSPIRDKGEEGRLPGLIYSDSFPPMLDLGLHLQEVADVVVSDMSGAIFDALYCGKPVVLVGHEDADFREHRKADESAIEVSQRHRIGPYVTHPSDLQRAVEELVAAHSYREANEKLVEECFQQRGGCGEIAAQGIREAVEAAPRPPVLQAYAAPDFSTTLLQRAWSAAKKRSTSGKKRKRPKRRPESMKMLAKNGRFLEAGLTLEAWRQNPRELVARNFYAAQGTVSAVRFSRVAWRRNLAQLFRSIYSPSTPVGREMLQELGMLRSASEWYGKAKEPIPPELAEKLQALGPLGGVLDLAARNEVAAPKGQMCITPDGEMATLASTPEGCAVELFLLASLSRELKDEDRRPYRASQLQFSRHLVESALASGFSVWPRIQAGINGPTSVSSKGPALTWHTLDVGRTGQVHLKIGTLFGHFIIDGKGYSGWSSIADKALPELISGVDPVEADQHWRWLRDELVAGGVSKYVQSDAELPPEWSEYVFLPMQVADDTVARLADIDTLSLLRGLADWGQATGRTVVVKRHPMCRDERIEMALREAEAAGFIRVSDANIHQLVAGASCVVTVNSGVGAEALLQLKPVITTGASDYAAATRRVRTLEELYAALGGSGLPVANEEQVKQFLWFYTKKYMVHFADLTAIGERLRQVLADAGYVAGPRRGGAPAAIDVQGTIDIPFVTAIDPGLEPLYAADDDLSLGTQCDELLRAFADAGVRCWVDSGSLLGLVRYGRLNHWEKDIDLGIWIEDFQLARKVCQEVANRHSLWYREKWLEGMPYALLLSSLPGKKRTTLPLSVHMFVDNGDEAWSPQPHSLVAARAKYPRYVYRKINGPNRAGLWKKVAFLARHPGYSVCIAAEKLNATARIGQHLKKIEQGTTLRERVLAALFLKVFQWRVPAHHFRELQPFSAAHPHIRVPGEVSAYLAARYGDWHVPVKNWFYLVDDGCITPISNADFQKRLAIAMRQVPSVPLLPQPAGEGTPPGSSEPVEGTSEDEARTLIG